MKNDKWIISLDMDGTTLLSKVNWDIEDGIKKPTAHPITLGAISSLQDKGHYVVVNTGRGWFGAKGIFEYLKLKTFAITSAGASISIPSEERIVINNPISKEVALQIVKDEILKGIVNEFYFDGHDYCHTYIINKTDLVESISVNRRVDIKEDLDLKFNPENMIISLNVDLNKSQEVIKYLNNKYGDDIIATNYQGNREGVVAIEFNSAKCDKGEAVLKLADYLGISRENTIAFGDGENDIDMLSKVKYGVAVKNALPVAKEKADIILDWTNDEGAVGLFLNEFFKDK